MPSDLKVPLVDDNPSVVARFGGAFVPPAKAAPAADAPVDDVPRLLVTKTSTLNTQGLLIEGLLVDDAGRDAGGGSEEEKDVLLDS